MLFSGGIMKQVIKAAAAAGIIDAVAKTNAGDRIINEAAKRTEDVAKLLEKIEEEIKEEEK